MSTLAPPRSRKPVTTAPRAQVKGTSKKPSNTAQPSTAHKAASQAPTPLSPSKTANATNTTTLGNMDPAMIAVMWAMISEGSNLPRADNNDDGDQDIDMVGGTDTDGNTTQINIGNGDDGDTPMDNDKAPEGNEDVAMADNHDAGADADDEAPNTSKDTSNAKLKPVVAWVPRPKGSAGNGFSLQEEMMLAGPKGSKPSETYLALSRNVKTLALNACLDWTLDWKDIPNDSKVKFFAVCRANHPFLGQFINDWATEEIVKQAFRNMRKTAVKKGELEKKDKYAHLAINASKRSSAASRVKKAYTGVDPKEKKRALKKVVKANCRKAAATAARRSKQAAVVDQGDGDDEMEVDLD
ncbi:hypothetical protein VNI00_016168 [Paramarasmius palmivorus]|uniref:Uncharacterized protein n=1 Tax=Paramarasmius palmivorus TaxID=297713 RepID=A0AAW0BDZ4_9AGAR